MVYESTLLSRFVVEKVCAYPLYFLPVTPALIIANVFDIYTFLTLWSVLAFVFLTIWLVVPCNPNLNCTADTKEKDGTKALLVSFIFLYSALLIVAITGRMFICSTGKPQGSVLGNIKSLFQLRADQVISQQRKSVEKLAAFN